MTFSVMSRVKIDITALSWRSSHMLISESQFCALLGLNILQRCTGDLTAAQHVVCGSIGCM